MNDQELEQLMLGSYENDAQTLTSDTESNLLKLKELLGALTDEESKRWADIKRKFQQNLTLQGVDTSDQVGQVVAQLRLFNEGLYAIREAVTGGVEHLSKQEVQSPDEKQQVDMLIDRLGGVQDRLEAIGRVLHGAAEQFR